MLWSKSFHCSSGCKFRVVARNKQWWAVSFYWIWLQLSGSLCQNLFVTSRFFLWILVIMPLSLLYLCSFGNFTYKCLLQVSGVCYKTFCSRYSPEEKTKPQNKQVHPSEEVDIHISQVTLLNESIIQSKICKHSNLIFFFLWLFCFSFSFGVITRVEQLLMINCTVLLWMAYLMVPF